MYVLLYRTLDDNVPTYHFRDVSRFLTAQLVSLNLRDTVELVSQGQVKNAWLHGTLVQTVTNDYSVKTPLVLSKSDVRSGEYASAFAFEKQPGLYALIETNGFMNVVSGRTLNRLIKTKAVTLLNSPIVRNGSLTHLIKI